MPVKAVSIIVGAAVLLILAYGEIDYQETYRQVDLQHYRQMARAAPHIDPTVPAPFSYRWLGPYLVGLLPVDDVTGFRILSYSAAVALALLFYAFLRAVHIGGRAAVYAVLLLMANRYFWGFPVFNFFQLDDLLGLISLLGGMWAIVKSRWGVLAVVMFVGVLAREQPLILVPVALVHAWERGKLREHGTRALVASAPALLCFIAVRLLLPSPEGAGPFEVLQRYGPKAWRMETWARLLVNAFVPISFMPLVFWKTTGSFFADRKYLLVFLGLVLLTVFFAHDQERMLSPGFVGYYWLVAYLLETRFPDRGSSMPLLLLVAVVSLPDHVISRFPLGTRDQTMVVSGMALVAATVMMIGTAVRQQRRG
jgi:hypothetical protein